MAEKDVFVIVIDAGEMPQEVSRVRANAEIVEPPRIDRDSHIRIIPVGGFMDAGEAGLCACRPFYRAVDVAV